MTALSPSLQAQLQAVLDRTAIVDVVVGAANAFDAQDWDRLRACLADELHTDYSAFRGEAPATVTADSYVAARREGLCGLTTLHVSTNHQIEIAGDRATCRSAYRIYRIDPARAQGENRLDTAGHYDHDLVRSPGGWRIRGIKQTVVLRQGASEVHGAFRPPAAKGDRNP